MAYVSENAGAAGKPLVKALFAASVLLSIVSWYTTMQGMALYLSTWFALLASLGVQTALVIVAWLVGFSRARRGLLITVYAITALVSIAFSYVSLYTWFSVRERPALVERQLYDTLNASAQKTEEILASAAAEAGKHVTALTEMTESEKSIGHISRATDADPYLATVREAVAREAQSMREGSGEGLRYNAFARYTKLAAQSAAQLAAAQKALSDFRLNAKPLDATEKQLRNFHAAYDPIPWNEVEQTLHTARIERPAIPNYADFVDRTATSQEDLLLAFTELFTAPTGRHWFAFTLAAFIDIIVFLLAFSSGPYFYGAQEERWCAAGAAMEGMDNQLFVRDFLRKVSPGANGLGRLDSSQMTPGEIQLCVLLAGRGMAAVLEENGTVFYLLDPKLHESMVESLASQRMPLRASAARAASV